MILYQDISGQAHQSPRTPAHLVGASGLVRRQSDAGDLVSVGDPMYCCNIPASPKWRAVGDQWQGCLVGELVPALLLRKDEGLPAILATADAQGRSWHAPVILAPDGAVALPLPLGRDDDGVWKRVPSEMQARWIATAKAARAELVGGGIAGVPIAAAADWACTLLEAIYHLTAAELGAFALLDDRLMLGVLLAAAGLARPIGKP